MGWFGTHLDLGSPVCGEGSRLVMFQSPFFHLTVFGITNGIVHDCEMEFSFRNGQRILWAWWWVGLTLFDYLSHFVLLMMCYAWKIEMKWQSRSERL